MEQTFLLDDEITVTVEDVTYYPNGGCNFAEGCEEVDFIITKIEYPKGICIGHLPEDGEIHDILLSLLHNGDITARNSAFEPNQKMKMKRGKKNG